MDLTCGWIKKIYEKHEDSIGAKLHNFVKDEWEKFKIDTDIAFNKYLNNSYNKYSKIKTILYRTEPKYIYDFFEYPNLSKKYDETINTEDIDEILSISKYVIIQGTGGLGKSTFMKHLFINELSKKDLIPIFIELKDINNIGFDYEIKDFIYQKLYSLGCDFKQKYMEYALQSGCFLFLLDGYDEILADKKDVFFQKITNFCDRYENNYYIISSRPYSEFVEFQRFSVLSLQPFTKKQAVSLIKKIDFDEKIKQKFIKALSKGLYQKHISFASNPLLLNIMLLTYDNYAEIPEKLHLFYANAFETLYSKHDATKGGYKRELKSSLSFDTFKKVFSYFCFITYYQGKVEFSYEELLSTLSKVKVNNVCFNSINLVYDLTNSVCLLYKDGINYKFTHRSFQEYFTAIFLKELSDNHMAQMGIELIKKDIYRATHDTTFNMLHDMCEERVEQNIIIPLLNTIEKDSSDNKYDFYYEKINMDFMFDRSTPKGEVELFMRARNCDDIMDFLMVFSYRYSARLSKSKEKELELRTEDLCGYLQEYCGYELGEVINVMEYRYDPLVYNLIKKTWIGYRIATLANLNNILNKKQRNNDIDLSELLIQ